MLALTQPIAPGAGRAVERLPDLLGTAGPSSEEGIYGEVCRVLRVPVVDALFRVLGGYPGFLEEAWVLMAGNLASLYLEGQADPLRARSLVRFRPPGYSEPDTLRAAGLSDADMDAIRAWNVTQQYVLPKLLVFAAAWDAALSGIALGGARLPLEEHAPLPSGIAPGAVALPAPAETSERVRDTFDRIREVHGHPLLHDYHRGLAAWPGYLERAWADMRSAAFTEEYTARGSELWGMARAAAAGMPFELPAGAAWVLGRGLSEEQVVEIRALLDLFARRIYPDVLIDVTLARAVMEGREAAGRSPLSVTGGGEREAWGEEESALRQPSLA
ncbi:MAG: hypothetical protein HY321_18375 [Armatimonadetes bacterium]|nr:hypothetical protein [Armatimonadota bacterium]